MSRFGSKLSDYYVNNKTRIQEDGPLNEQNVEAFQFEEDEAIERQKKLDAVSASVDFDSLAKFYAKEEVKKTVNEGSTSSRNAPTLAELRKLRRTPISMSEKISADDQLDDEQNESNIEEVDARRKIDYKIQKNKGLVAKRKKGTEHSRIKRKWQYKKALHRKRSQIPEVRREMTKYGGEARGIRSATVKSIKFRA